jgi:hypothetical protein
MVIEWVEEAVVEFAGEADRDLAEALSDDEDEWLLRGLAEEGCFGEFSLEGLTEFRIFWKLDGLFEFERSLPLRVWLGEEELSDFGVLSLGGKGHLGKGRLVPFFMMFWWI